MEYIIPSFLKGYVEIVSTDTTHYEEPQLHIVRDAFAGEFEPIAWHNCQVRMSVGRVDAVELYYQDCARLRAKLGNTYTPTATDQDRTISDNIYPALCKWY